MTINIPNYEIGKLAGKGGVAEVYLARHTLLDRTVAIKLISPSRSDDIADKRFLKEAKVVAGLRHTNIVSIYDVGVYENKYYIIMEYLDGGDLKKQIKLGLSTEQSLSILRQIAEALIAAHNKGFIHRDIKSANIMFRADGTAVLTDFGIVKDISADSGYTLDGTSIGTPNYMSPEQALGSEKIDWRTDLYSLGVTFYEMLTGTLPYVADSAVAVALKHIKDPVPVLPETLERFQPIIDKMMAKNPEDRFQSVRELHKAIDALSKGKDSGTSTQENLASEARETLSGGSAGREKIKPGRLVFNIAVVGMAIGFLVMLVIPYLDDLREPPHSLEKDQKKVSFKVKKADDAAKSISENRPSVQASVRPEPVDGKSDPLMNAIVKKDYDQALAAISRIRDEQPEPSHPLVQQADGLLRSGQFLSAGDVYNSVLSVDSRNSRALFGLVYAVLQQQKDLIAQARPSITENEALMELLDKAGIHTASPYVKQLKTNAVEWVYQTSGGFFENNELDQAEQWVTAGLKFAPDHMRMKKLRYLILAQRRFDENRLTVPDQDNALFYYEEILKMDRNAAAAKAGISRIAARYGETARDAWGNRQFPEAVQRIEKARALAPADQSLAIMEWLIRGDMYVSKAQYASPGNENALYCYRQALTLAPDDRETMIRIAKVDVHIPLQQIRRAEDDLIKKLPAYQSFFTAMDRVVSQYGRESTADLENAALAQAKSDIQRHVDKDLAIPGALVDLMTTRFPHEKAFFVSSEKILRERAEILRLLNNIKNIQAFNDKLGSYRSLLETLDAVMARHGKARVGDLQSAVTAQIKKDVQLHHIDLKETIPDAFIDSSFKYLPEIDGFLKRSQYDIWIEKGDAAVSDGEKIQFYLEALRLYPKEPAGIGRIANLAGTLDGAGKNGEALDMLQRASDIAPGNEIFDEALSGLRRVLKIFATASEGCENENSIIFNASVTLERLNLCIRYKNFNPNSIITVVLTHESGMQIKIPVVLEGRSGKEAIAVTAPMEGFILGKYLIAAIQEETVLSETRMQFLPPKRR
jgi:serine/threonine-protein kinase PpkA